MPHYPDRPGFVAGNDTSLGASLSLDDESLSRLRRRVYFMIARRKLHGATCDEVEVVLELRHQTASARIRELVLTDFVFDSGIRRLTRSGRYARVYIRTP
jgi:hypothetical protein